MSNTGNFFGGGSYNPDIEQNTKDIQKIPGKNLLINGDFSVWQRGASFTGYVYGSDRWVGGTNAVTSKQWSEDYGTVCRVRATSNPSAAVLQQAVELLNTGFGVAYSPFQKETTYTITVRGDSGGVLVTPNVRWAEGTATASVPASSSTFTPKALVSTGTTWSFTMNSDLDSATHKCMVLYFALGTINQDVDFYDVKLEHGDVATPFVADDPATNLAKCQRYFFTTRGRGKSGVFGNGTISSTASGTFQVGVPLPTCMRVTKATVSLSGDHSIYGVSSAGGTITEEVTMTDGGAGADIGFVDIILQSESAPTNMRGSVAFRGMTSASYMDADAEL